jgi:GT2 family glycosyltransferase
VDHPDVSVLVVAYDNGPALVRCLDSILADGAGEVVLVNNGKHGPEIDYAASLARVHVVPTDANLGFGGGCNLAASLARGEVLLFLNPDTVVEPGAVAALSDLARQPDVGIASPRLRLERDRSRLNSAGGAVHISGLGWATGLGTPAEQVDVRRDVPAATGAAMAIRREVFEALGGFRDEYFLYHEDVELSWRAHLHGLRVLLTPAADVLHEYEFSRNPDKFALVERNRLQFVLTTYSGRLLAAVAPVLVAYEITVVLHAARRGWLAGKVRGWWWCWRHRDLLRRRRRENAALRRVPDRDLVGFLTASVADTPIPMPAYTRAANVLMRWYWRRARRWV